MPNIEKLLNTSCLKGLKAFIAITALLVGATGFAQNSPVEPQVNRIQSELIANDKFLEKTREVYCSQVKSDWCDSIMTDSCLSTQIKNLCTLYFLLEKVAMEDSCKGNIDVESCKARISNAYVFVSGYISDQSIIKDLSKNITFRRCTLENPYEFKSNIARKINASIEEHQQTKNYIRGNRGLESCLKRAG